MSLSGDSPLIREARSGDAPRLAELFDELDFSSSVVEIETRLNAMQANGELILVAEREGVVIGIATVHITPVLHRPTPVGRITALVVMASQRGKGVGRNLVFTAERAVLERGCALIEITSNLKWTGAHGFYERLGYEITSYRLKKTLAGEKDGR